MKTPPMKSRPARSSKKSPLPGFIICGLTAGWLAAASAGERVLLPAVGLNDLTLLPAVTAERERTSSLAPAMRRQLAQAGYELMAEDDDPALEDEVASGYLAAHPQAAAAHARRVGTDWIAVVRLTKPSFLYCYVVADLVNARTGRRAGNAYVELKGPMSDAKLTARGAAALAAHLDRKIRAASTTLVPAAGR